ncbi:MAG TPA: GNAT family N-acetyltransferase [Micromonosporaceae bacterium]|nr:GNAT family N-acetyltransferase [Micromonosporaceae bacterium]
MFRWVTKAPPWAGPMRVDTPVLLRDATASDAAAIGEVHAAAWQVAYRDLFEASWLNTFVEIRRSQWESRMIAPGFAKATLLVAVRGDRVCAFAYFGPHTIRSRDGEIYGFYAHPTVWGTGVAAALMNGAWDLLVDGGYPTVRLWTLAGANRARRFYRRFGFEESGNIRERDFGDGRPVLEIEYRRSTGNYRVRPPTRRESPAT